ELKMLYDKGFRGIVTYAFNNGREKIPEIAKKIGFHQVIAGLWATDASYQTEKANLQADGKLQLKYIDGICVGNETQLRQRKNEAGGLTFDQLKARIDEIRQISGKPTTTADAWNLYVEDRRLMTVGDWVFPNLHPWYENGWAPAHQDPAKGVEFV